MFERDDVTVGKSLEYGWNKRRVADPMAQMSAAGLYAEGLGGLSKGKFKRLVERFMSLGMSRNEAQKSVLKMIYANNMRNQVL